ncbi:hypothetical protein Mal15_03420 [Stieleria maiorica]|uniref:Uncharacterized protein n=1 Tax=Stieleria maiorica TaxID=2795974 RepID=A0A5B9M9V7_9BACT|nr:hypothetical protein [Stieleria maiorica]QEF96315.1 hypothetical protein Mal15_03420 [Stieleria maiorica]
MNAPQRRPSSDPLLNPPPDQPDGDPVADESSTKNSSSEGGGAALEGVSAVAPQHAAALLAELKREMNRLQREIRLAIQAQLGRMAGQSLGSIEANRELARSIQEMLDAHGLRVRCTHCGNPAILRVSPRSGAAAGVFVFDHTIDGRRTFHGGRIQMPEIRLVAKPARKPRGEKKAG